MLGSSSATTDATTDGTDLETLIMFSIASAFHPGIVFRSVLHTRNMDTAFCKNQE